MKHLLTALRILVLVLIYATIASAGEVWVITSLDWQPYSDSNSPQQGFSIHKLRTLLKRENIELRVEFYPWSRARETARQDGYVGYFPAWPEEVVQGFTASPPVDWSDFGVMTYQGSGTKWTSIEDVFDERLGLVTSYVYPDDITKLARTKPNNVDPTPNELTLLRKLSQGRFKRAITSPTVMHYLAKKEGITNIRTLKILGEKPLVIAFRNSPENMKRLRLLEKLLEQQPACN